MTKKKYVYLFKEGNADMRELLGGKGANLAEMTKIGLPVPQGFTITTEACTQYYEDGRKINDEIQAEIMENIVKMEEITGKKFGDMEKIKILRNIQGVASIPKSSKLKVILPILNKLIDDDYVDGNQKEVEDLLTELKGEQDDLSIRFGEV